MQFAKSNYSLSSKTAICTELVHFIIRMILYSAQEIVLNFPLKGKKIKFKYSEFCVCILFKQFNCSLIGPEQSLWMIKAVYVTLVIYNKGTLILVIPQKYVNFA